MKKVLIPSLATFALVLGAGFANAQYVEDFSGITAFTAGSATVSGSPTMGIFDQFGGGWFADPVATLVADDSTDFEEAADDNYITYTSDGDVFYYVNNSGGTTLANTDGVLQAAFVIRVNSLDADPANNVAWLFRADTGNAGTVDVGIRAEGGEILLESDNGYTQTFFETSAFKQGAGTWEGTGWRVLAVRADRQTDGSGTITIWEINKTTGVATVLHNETGVTNTNVGEIGRCWFAAWDTAVLPSASYSNVSVSYDNVSIYPNDTVTNETEFLSAVAGDYSASASVRSWDLY